MAKDETLRDLQNLSDDELRELVETAGEVLARREDEKKQQAIEEARTKLAAVGLTLKDIAAAASGTGKKKRNGTGPKYEKGSRYVNPANSEEEWVAGRGRPPKWLAELEAKGTVPAPRK